MYPEICRIGPFTIYSYGVMLAIAVLICSILLSRDGKKIGINTEVILDFIFWVVLGGIVGARLFYVILNLSYFIENPFEIFLVQRGGLAWQGSLFAGGAISIFYIKNKALPLAKTLDLVAPYFALGQSIGRIGCFLTGCCYGKLASWGIYFPVHHAHLHPTQLYASAGLFLIFLILKRYQRKTSVDGGVFILYLVLASSLRFFIEFFRADHFRTYLNLSIFQIVCVIVFIGALYAGTRLKSRAGQ